MTPLRTLFRIAVLASAAWIVSGIPAGSAMAASCAYTQTSTLFSQWNDANLYTPFQGSTFESGASGWSWGGGANIVNGDGNTLLSATSTHSVQIPGGGTAKSPWLCVNSYTPSMRFFVRRVSGTGDLRVRGLIASGGSQLTTVTTIADATSVWSPSDVVSFPPTFTATTTGVNVQIQFVADAGTTFRIDDVELDPYLRR
jgi:hypothetical protein